MSEYDDKLWREMIEKFMDKYANRVAELDFWVEVKDLHTRDGGYRSESYPRLSVSFK